MRSLRIAIALASLGLACGSEESRMERGVAVDEEVAAPSSEGEDALDEAQRRAEEESEEERASAERFDEAQRKEAE